MSAASIITSTAIDLSRLPAPDVIETLDFDTIFGAQLADLIVRYPAFSALVESDPAYKVLEVNTYREMLLRQRINEAARAVMIAYAKGADLDQLVAVFGVTRLTIVPADPLTGAAAVLESDDDLRRRVLLSADSYSVAGPASAYIFHAVSASGDVLDASTTSPAPGEVLVAVLSRIGDGTAAPALLDLVEAAVSSDSVRPLTDAVTVQSAQIVEFTIVAELWVYAGPDSALLLDAATAALDEFLANARRLGRNIPRSAISAALHVAGIQRVDLIEPAADLLFDSTQAGYCTDADVIIAGTSA